MKDEKILFFPENYSKNLKSTNYLKPSDLLLNNLKPSKHSSVPRKNLPQTSNRLLFSKRKANPVLQSLATCSDLSEDHDFFTRLSPPLSKLLKKVSKLYKDCEIIPDNSFPEFGLYSYLFDSHCKRINKFSDIKSKPDFLFISCRFNLAELIFPGENKRKNEKIPEKTVNCVNLYSSIVVDDKNSQGVTVVKRKNRGPVYKLKTLNSPYKVCKTPEVQAYPACSEVKPIFPCASGFKMKEGTGGFRRPQLYFEKRKTSLSPTLCVGDSSKKSHSPTRISLKDSMEYD
jgi:hypothetical protein